MTDDPDNFNDDDGEEGERPSVAVTVPTLLPEVPDDASLEDWLRLYPVTEANKEDADRRAYVAMLDTIHVTGKLLDKCYARFPDTRDGRKKAKEQWRAIMARLAPGKRGGASTLKDRIWLYQDVGLDVIHRRTEDVQRHQALNTQKATFPSFNTLTDRWFPRPDRLAAKQASAVGHAAKEEYSNMLLQDRLAEGDKARDDRAILKREVEKLTTRLAATEKDLEWVRSDATVQKKDQELAKLRAEVAAMRQLPPESPVIEQPSTPNEIVWRDHRIADLEQRVRERDQMIAILRERFAAVMPVATVTPAENDNAIDYTLVESSAPDLEPVPAQAELLVRSVYEQIMGSSAYDDLPSSNGSSIVIPPVSKLMITMPDSDALAQVMELASYEAAKLSVGGRPLPHEPEPAMPAMTDIKTDGDEEHVLPKPQQQLAQVRAALPADELEALLDKHGRSFGGRGRGDDDLELAVWRAIAHRHFSKADMDVLDCRRMGKAAYRFIADYEGAISFSMWYGRQPLASEKETKEAAE